MRSWPEVKFVKNDTIDDDNLTKLATRLMELGVITPEQGMKVVATGTFPDPEEMGAAQDRFKEEREKGYYMPLVNSINLFEEEPEKPAPTEKPKAIAPSGGRPVGVSNSKVFSKKNIIAATKQVNEFELRAFREFAAKFGLKRMSKEKKDLVSRACESIIVAKDHTQWDESLSEVVENLDSLASLGVHDKVLELGAEHQLDDLSSAILYHSTQICV